MFVMQVIIPISDAINVAKVTQRNNKNAFIGSPQWYTVDKCPGMRKKDGKILISISIHFEDADTKKLQTVRNCTCCYAIISMYVRICRSVM